MSVFKFLILNVVKYNFELLTPNKDNTGVSKTIFMHVSNFHRLLCDWIKLIDKGTKICKSIALLNLHDSNDDYYPHRVENLTDSLLDSLYSMRDILDSVKILDSQLKALAKLQPEGTPVIFTWSAAQISENISKMYALMQKEYKLKEVITENIAHCQDECLMEVFASGWEFDIYFRVYVSDYLFVETGLPSVF
ncbi:uncharacterized protein [Epargyreus clarus]|uniref:uncharacterized protein isoform X2 n=1 Tax=Epargyreus clarus TaxID=520877 RepID=UPI003C2DCD10